MGSLLFFIIIIWAIYWFKKSKNNKTESKKQQDVLDERFKNLSSEKDSLEAQKQKLNEKEEKLNQQQEKIDSKISELDQIQSEIKKLEQDKINLENVIVDIDNNVSNTIAESSIDLGIPDDTTSSELKSKLALLKNEEKDMNTTDVDQSYTSQRIANNYKRKLLTPFNSEVSGILNNLTISNVESSRNKIVRSFEKINKIFKDDGVSITDDLLSLKLRYLDLTYQYLVKRSQEKEQQKAIKEQMVEEERARRELEAENKKLDKEHKQFSNELQRLLKYLNNSTDSVQSEMYADEIKGIKQKISDVEERQSDIEHRQTNTRAGFVYIISNIGSFGENIFKIGMTKRLNPLDRINELSSASVPFIFDVHAMIFSDDAPKLENELHQAFATNAVNKINPRKEFYNVSIDDISKEIEKNHPDAIMQLTKLAKAEEYRRSLELSK